MGAEKTERWQQIQCPCRRKPQRVSYPGPKRSRSNIFFKPLKRQEIIRRNGTLRIFDKLGRRMHTQARRKGGVELATDKLHLFDDYSTPKPLHGVDKFGKAGVLTDYQWIIASHK